MNASEELLKALKEGDGGQLDFDTIMQLDQANEDDSTLFKTDQ